MKPFVILTLLAASASSLCAAAPQVITKDKAPVTVLPRYLPDATAAGVEDSAKETLSMERFVVTGSMLPKSEVVKPAPKTHHSKH